jgi:hypothetical protein
MMRNKTSHLPEAVRSFQDFKKKCNFAGLKSLDV